MTGASGAVEKTKQQRQVKSFTVISVYFNTVHIRGTKVPTMYEIQAVDEFNLFGRVQMKVSEGGIS